MAISEELQGQMAENMKTLKTNKAQVFKKVHVREYGKKYVEFIKFIEEKSNKVLFLSCCSF